MNTVEIIAITDMISTLVLEFWAEYKNQNPNPMTAEEFAAISAVMKDRRKLSMAAILAH